MTEQVKRGFKKKTIEKTIKAKMKAWINSIEDKELQKKIHEDYIITGGAITSMLLGETPNDYDVYFKTNDTAIAVANYYTKNISASGKVGKITVSSRENGGGVEIMIKSVGIARSDKDNFNDYE